VKTEWSDWKLAWDGRAAFREKLPITSPLPAKWFQWRYRFEIVGGFGQSSDVAAVQTLVGLMSGGVASFTVGQFNSDTNIKHKVIFDIVDVVKWEMTTYFTIVDIAYQFGGGGFASYAWYSQKQELITYLPGTGDALGLDDESNATILRARELDKYHPISKVVTSNSGESYPWENEEIDDEPLETLGTKGIIVTQDSKTIDDPNFARFYGWFIGPLYKIDVPAGALLDIKFHNVGVPVGDRWAFIQTRSSLAPFSPAVSKLSSFQGDTPSKQTLSPFNHPRDQDGKNSDAKNAFFAPGASGDIGRSEVYYPDPSSKVMKQFTGVTDFNEARDTYKKSILMGGGSGEKITFPDIEVPIDTETVQGVAPDFIKNEQGVSNVFYHIEITGKLLKPSFLYRSIINGVAIKTAADLSAQKEGKLKFIFSEDGSSVKVEEEDSGASIFVEKTVVSNSRLVSGKTYEFKVQKYTEKSDGNTYFFLSDLEAKKGIYCVQSSDQGETWERNLANIENPDNFNGGAITVGGEIIAGIEGSPDTDPVLIAENESFPVSIKEDSLGDTKLFSIRKNTNSNSLVLRKILDVDLYSQRTDEAQSRDKNLQDTQALILGGNWTPSSHEVLFDNFPYEILSAFRLNAVNQEQKRYAYDCLKCGGQMSFEEYRNGGGGNKDTKEIDKKYDQIIYKCSACLTEYDLMALFKRELVDEQPIAFIKMSSGAHRIFYVVGPQDWTLNTNIINDTSVETYDYIPFLEGFVIHLNTEIENSSWTIYIDEKGKVTYKVDPSDASTSILSMSAEKNPMLRKTSFTFEIRNKEEQKVFSIPQSLILSRYTLNGTEYIYDSQFNRSMLNEGHAGLFVKYDYESNGMRMFSCKEGALYLFECALTPLNETQIERRDRGLLPLSEEELTKDISFSVNSRFYLLVGKITQEYQENINRFPDRYFLGNYKFFKTLYDEGEIKQFYLYDANNNADIMKFEEYDNEGNVIYWRVLKQEKVNLTKLTENDLIDNQVISYNKTVQGEERVFYQKSSREIKITAGATVEDLYNGFSIVFGELQEGWVSLVFQGTMSDEDLIIDGTAKSSVSAVSINNASLINREVRFSIVNDEGYKAKTDVTPAILQYKNAFWQQDERNI